MERRPDELATPWRILGEPTPSPSEPVAAAGLPLPLLGLGIAATVVLAVVAFMLAGAASEGAMVRVDGATTVAGSPALGTSEAAAGTDGVGPGAGGASAVLVVDVGGAVARPGVYRLPPGARVGDAIQAAGGFGSRVDAARASAELNLAAVINDGDRIRVPSRDDPSPPPPDPAGSGGTAAQGAGGGAAAPEGNGPVGLLDLNSATSAQLEDLPGIGPVLAGRIIESREERPFRSVEELRERGILGSATYAKVADLVTVR